MRSYNPTVQAPWFGLFRFRSPLLSESRLISLPPGTEMVHFPGLTRTRLCIQRAVYRVHRYGFPHSEIPGSKPACGSPRLIAASHVLLRLLAPRHPPYALSSLTIKLTQHVPIRIGLGYREASPRRILRSVEKHTSDCACGQVRLSTCATRAKLADHCTHELEIACAMASFLQLSKSVNLAPGEAR